MNNSKHKHLKRSALWRLLIHKKKFFISPKFQRHFIFYVMSVTLVSLAIFFISQQVFFQQFHQSGEQLGLPSGHPYFQLLKDQQTGLSKIFFITSGLIALFTLFSALFFSHRIAGPLYRLDQYFKNAAHESNAFEQPLSFRKDDFFQELPDSINHFMQQQNLKDQKNKSISMHHDSSQKGNTKAN